MGCTFWLCIGFGRLQARQSSSKQWPRRCCNCYWQWLCTTCLAYQQVHKLALHYRRTLLPSMLWSHSISRVLRRWSKLQQYFEQIERSRHNASPSIHRPGSTHRPRSSTQPFTVEQIGRFAIATLRKEALLPYLTTKISWPGLISQNMIILSLL